MTRLLTIEVPGLPCPYARSGGHGKIRFTPAKQRGAMADLKIFASRAMEGRKPFEIPLAAEFNFMWPVPMSWTMKRRLNHLSYWKTSRPDADNLQKLVCDALNGIVWSDDAIIAYTTTKKIYADDAKTIINVWAIDTCSLQRVETAT